MPQHDPSKRRGRHGARDQFERSWGRPGPRGRQCREGAHDRGAPRGGHRHHGPRNGRAPCPRHDHRRPPWRPHLRRRHGHRPLRRQRRLSAQHLVYGKPPVRALQDGRRHRRGPRPHADPARELPSQPGPEPPHERDGHAPSHCGAHEPAHEGPRHLRLRAPPGREPVRGRPLAPAAWRGRAHDECLPAHYDAADHTPGARPRAAAPHHARARQLRHARRRHDDPQLLRDPHDRRRRD